MWPRGHFPERFRNCFWGGSGSDFLLLGRFRVSISPSGTVQGLNFFFWRVQGDSFFTWAASEKGPARFQRKNANFTIKPCGQEATSRRGSEIASGVVQGLIFFFWDGSGSQLLLLKRFRVSNSSSGRFRVTLSLHWLLQKTDRPNFREKCKFYY